MSLSAFIFLNTLIVQPCILWS